MAMTPTQEIAMLKDILGRLIHRSLEPDSQAWRLPGVSPDHIDQSIAAIRARIHQIETDNMIIDN